MVLTNGRWQDALNDFADLVKNGEYSKMDYHTWQKMRKWNKDKDITIWSSSNDVIVFPCESSNVIDTEMFGSRDGSFGQYLKEHWLDAEVIYNTADKVYKSIDYDGTWETTADGVITAKTDYMQSDSTTLNSVNVNSITLDDYYYTTGTSNAGYINIGAEDIQIGSMSIVEKINELEAKIDTKQDKIPTYDCEKEKESKNMNMFKGFDFGRVDGSAVRMSMYGLAIKNQAGVWVSYNTATNEIIDVDVLNFNGEQFMYKMPVALSQVSIGDVIIHQRKPMFITEICESGNKFVAIDIYEGEEKMILASKSPFGFNFITKIISFMDMGSFSKPTAENPFGNMAMLMAMSGDGDMSDMMPMMLMMNGGFDMSNPMSAMLMMNMMNKDSNTGMNDMMMMAMMSGAFNQPQGKTE